MQRALVKNAVVALALLAGVAIAAAQNQAQPEAANPQPKAPNETKKDPVPPATDKSEETRAGTTEPSSKVKSTTDSSAFVNGVLAVPGASTDVDTAPAKFSARSARDDAIPIAGYVLRHLTDDQRSRLFESLRSTESGPANSNERYSQVGAQVPAAIALAGLRAVPDSVIASSPEMRDVMFTMVGQKLLLINPRTRVVIGVLGP